MANKKIRTSTELKFKLSNAVTLQRWLQQLPLEGQASRKRTQFVSLLGTAQGEVEAERTRLLHLYAQKDEDGNPLTFIDEQNVQKYDLTTDNEQKFNDELNAFLNKDFSLSVEGDQVKLMDYIAKVVENTDFKFSGQLAQEYDAWMDAFENA